MDVRKRRAMYLAALAALAASSAECDASAMGDVAMAMEKEEGKTSPRGLVLPGSGHRQRAADQQVDPLRLLVDHPVGALGDALHAQVRHEVTQPVHQ